jgi:uroporphyrinogen-III synthase
MEMTMPDPMLLWVTRSAPFNLRTRGGLAGLGHRAITTPALQIRAVDPVAPAREPTALVFTSAQAIRHRPLEARWRSLPIFTIGDHCASVATGCGYSDVRSAGGSLDELRDMVVGSVSRFGHVVHFAARAPSGRLVDDLKSADLSAEHSVAYESVPATGDELISVTAAMPFLEGIVVHSPKAAAVAADLARQTGWHGIVFSLSPACSAPFEDVPGILVETAPQPTEEALIAQIGSFRVPRSRRATRSIEGLGSAPPKLPLRLVVSNLAPHPMAANDRCADAPGDPPPSAA